MSTPKLELVNLTKQYDNGDVLAVDNINLSVAAGETIALLGSSGCGKSTTLNMIVGLETPTSGEICIDGVPVSHIPAGKRNVGLVFQDYAVFTSMTVRGNLAFGLEVRKTPKAEIARAVGEVAELLGMADRLDVPARELGGSELQRVAIGRTLVTRPSILLLDEPLSNLETAARLAMRQELRRLQHEIGLTIIYVTHDQVEALSLADRIAVMNGGRILQVAHTREICERPGHVYVAGFLGSPAMNLLSGHFSVVGNSLRFHSDALALPVGRVEDIIPAAGMPEDFPGELPYVMGMRPERLSVCAPGQGSVDGRLVLTEPRGHDAVLTVAVGEQTVKVVCPASFGICEGDAVGIVIPTDALTFFDGTTNLRTSILHS